MEKEQSQTCGLKKPFFDDVATMAVNSFNIFAENTNLVEMSMFKMYFAGFLSGVTGLLSITDEYKICRDCECDNNCDECDIADRMKVHFLATALRIEMEKILKEHMQEENEEIKKSTEKKIL